MPKLVYRTDRVSVFRTTEGLRALIRVPPARGAPVRNVPTDPEVVHAIAESLVRAGVLWNFGGQIIFRFDEVDSPVSFDVATAQLGRRILFASCPDTPPDVWRNPGAAEDLDGLPPTSVWRQVCEANGWTPLVLNAPTLARGLLGGTDAIPEYIGTLAHPLFGEAPSGTFSAKLPGRGPEGYLKALFEPLPLSPCHRLRLYAWFFYHLHARSLIEPSPLLFVDSWRPSMGKTQACSAIEILIDGTHSPLAPPPAGDSTELVAHFMADRRMATLDNLDTARPYQHAWLANLLTSRSAGARAKYAMKSTAFRGRMIAMTMVYGYGSLHADLRDRCWRIELPGHERLLFSEGRPPLEFARIYRDEILAEAYHMLASTPPWNHFNPSEDRSPSAIYIGMPPAARLLGHTQEEVAVLLRAHKNDSMAYDPRFVRALVHAGGCSSDVYTPQALPSRRSLDFVNVSACGWRAIEEGGRCVLKET